MIARLDRFTRGAFWLTLFAGVMAAWVAIYAMAIPTEVREASRLFGSAFWSEICNVTPDAAGYFRLVLMWALMSTAMMLPTALPALRAYDDVASSGAATQPFRFVAGFIAIWWGFSLVAAALQLGLFQADIVSAVGDSRSALLSSGLLALAGAYQFSAFKETCANKCRAPMAFLLQHWSDGAWQMGLRLGLTCLGCCWALMLLAFVGGMMSLAFMGLATVIMVLEKLPEIGNWVGRPLGLGLLAAAVWVAFAGI